MSYHLNREQLLIDIRQAYLDARRHKLQKPYQQHFEQHADENLEQLCDELWTYSYQPGSSACFIITDPKKREVFAAQFRDRIVHHLYYNYVHDMLERTFIVDSYSCIKNRGTHYGIARLERHIRCESQNYQEPCFVLKMDIRGYFMHIDRCRLLGIVIRQLRKMRHHKIEKGKIETWEDRIDMPFVEWLTQVIIMQDPTECCYRRGSLLDWQSLPHDKSLFHSAQGCGLPIGNLTSQLFSNVYLNELDQYMKRQLGCRHYGRYVDDFYVVSADYDWLKSLIRPVSLFLNDSLALNVNFGKTHIADVRQGVEFLGAYLKPHRRYVRSATVRRTSAKIPILLHAKSPDQIRCTLNSYLGLFSHYRSFGVRCRLFSHMMFVYRYGYFQSGMNKFVLYPFCTTL